MKAALMVGWRGHLKAEKLAET
jgi:primosomal protein N''